LVCKRRFPGLVDVFLVKVFELRDVFSDEEAFFVPFLGEGDGAVAAVKLCVECGAG